MEIRGRGIWVCRWWTREKARGRVKQDDDRSPREVLEKMEVPRKRSTTVHTIPAAGMCSSRRVDGGGCWSETCVEYCSLFSNDFLII